MPPGTGHVDFAALFERANLGLLRDTVLRAAWLGAFPCPMACFTLGVLALSRGPVPGWLLIVPGFWAVSGVIPFRVGVREDLGLVVFGLVALVAILLRGRRIRRLA